MQDSSLHDEQLDNEIRLVGDLVLAASQSEQPMTLGEIDDVLGIPEAEGEPGGGAQAAAEAG